MVASGSTIWRSESPRHLGDEGDRLQYVEVLPPRIFISATTKDLRFCREEICTALQKIGCTPVVQENFPADARDVSAMLRAKIEACESVVHVAGLCYGGEPRQPPPGEARRSYTQLEYDTARVLQKPVYTFICTKSFPYLDYSPEVSDLHALQQAHREELRRRRELYYEVHTLDELLEIVLTIPDGREVYLRAIEEQSRAHAAALSGKDEEIRHLRAQLELQTQLTERVLAKIGPLAVSPGAGEPRDPAAAAQVELAQERGLSLERLREQLELERSDVRKLVEQIIGEREAAVVHAEAWTTLQKEALGRLGGAEYAAGRYREAIESYRKALALFDLEEDPFAWCTAAADIEAALWQQGLYTEAEPLARQVLELRERLLGKGAPDTLTSMNNLALLLKEKGDHAGAEPLFRRALEGYERTLGKEHPHTLTSMNNLALVLYAKGDYAGAESLYRRALEARERTLGKEHPDTLTSVNTLAPLLYAQGDYAGAEPLYRRAVEGRERTLGKEHPDTLTSVNNLAALLYAQGDYAGAEPLDRRTLEARERTLGKEHPDTLTSVNNLAALLLAQRDYAGAESLCRRALEARERTLGKEHPDTLTSVNNLAGVLEGKGDYAGAESLCRRALEARERTLGKEHPDTLTSVNNLGLLLKNKGDYAGAEPLFRRALEGRERTLGKEHPDTIMTAYNLSALYEKQKRLPEASALARQAVEGARKSLPELHPHRVVYEQHLVRLLKASP